MRRLAAPTLMLVVFSALATSAQANHNLIQHVSTGPTDPQAAENALQSRISKSGNAVVFNSGQKLVAADTDNSQDVYVRHDGVTDLVSAGQINGSGNFPASFSGLSTDGSRIWFRTQEQLVPQDTDSFFDIYERYQGQTTQITTGPMNANQPSSSAFAFASPDGTHVYFATVEPLTANDPDLCIDLYERSGGVTTLVTHGKISCAPPGYAPRVVGYADTPDGPSVTVATSYRLSTDDVDADDDVYEMVAGQVRLLSQGPGTHGPSDKPALVEGFSSQANASLIWSFQPLTADDLDSNSDLFLADDGALTRLTTGPVGGNGNYNLQDINSSFGLSGDGNHAYFTTAEQLTIDDADTADDLYERNVATGTTRLIGNAGTFFGVAGDASHVIFGTAAQLVPEDMDAAFDLYDDQSGVITQVTTGNGAFTHEFIGVSNDGARVFFITSESYGTNDTNDARDLYERYNGTTYLLSRDAVGVAAGVSAVGNPGDVAAGLTYDGRTIEFTSPASLAPTDTDSNIDIYVATRTPDAYARPKAATPINVAFVPAYAACASPNRVHAAPLAFNSCAPPAQTSSYLTLGTPDANGQGAKSVANLRLLVLPGNPSTPANEADARYEVSITDVRNKSDLTDYTGALKLDAPLRITDRNNPDVDGGSPNATGSQPSFPVIVPCAATGDTTVGSTCSITTTANTLAPGAAIEGMRAIWETGQVRVSDGGADGNPATADGDGVFLVQGVFIP